MREMLLCEWDAFGLPELRQYLPTKTGDGTPELIIRLSAYPFMGSEFSLIRLRYHMLPNLPSNLIVAGEWWPLCMRALLVGYTKIFFVFLYFFVNSKNESVTNKLIGKWKFDLEILVIQ